MTDERPETYGEQRTAAGFFRDEIFLEDIRALADRFPASPEMNSRADGCGAPFAAPDN